MEIIKRTDEYLIALNAPKEFGANMSSNIVVQMDKSFAALCASMESAGVKEPENLSLFNFYSKLEYYEKQKASQNANRID